MKQKIYDDPLYVKALKKPGYAWVKLTRKFTHFFEDNQRVKDYDSEKAEIVNQKEMRIFGLRRSGNHAVITWITEQQSGVVKHLNDVPPFENPFRYTYEYCRDNYPGYPKIEEKLRQEAIGNFTKKDCLLFNYEDYDFNQVISKNFERKHDIYVGKSTKRYDLLILRDPFNLLASRIKKGFVCVKSSRKSFVDVWISHAKEFLGETNYLTQQKVCINYNQWVNDIDYRRQIAEQLDLNFTDEGINIVSRRAGGSFSSIFG